MEGNEINSAPGPQPIGTPGLTRPARVFIGWMPQAQGEVVLQGNTMGAASPQEQARRAREAVEGRRAGFDQVNLVSKPPAELTGHVERLRETPDGAQMFREGWQVEVVDLARVCAFQPHVFVDGASERVEDIKADDIEAIAAVTLPTELPEPPTIQFDPMRQAYVAVSPSPNLKLVGQLGMVVQNPPGAYGLGLIVRVMPSFMQVVHFDGRYLLRDGYHRAFGLLARGITHAPVFTRSMQAIEEVVPPGMLPQGAYLGQRPPLVRDYHDDSVAIDAHLPDTQRMVVIQGTELNSPRCE